MRPAASFSRPEWAAALAVVLAMFLPSGRNPAARADDSPAQPGGAAANPGRSPPDRPLRDVDVKVACDEEFRRGRADWQLTAGRCLREASAAFERDFGIRFVPAEFVAWTSDDAASDLEALLDDLDAQVARGARQLVVGFTGQRRAAGSDREYYFQGMARSLGPSAIVRTANGPDHDEVNTRVLTHELGHCFGAWHSSDPTSFMWGAELDRQARFDDPSAAVIGLMRDYDLRRGFPGLPAELESRIEDVYRKCHTADCPLPFVAWKVKEAWRTTYVLHDVAKGRATYREAVALEERCAGAQDPALVPPLRDLARALLLDPADLDAAETAARRARKLAEGTSERPPLASIAVLADVARKRGRLEEAMADYRMVYDARLHWLGAADRDTVQVKTCLDACTAERRAARTQWTEMTCEKPPAAGGGKTPPFDAPAPGTLHLRPLPVDAAWAGTAPVDHYRASFEVQPSEPGEVVVEFREVGPAAGAPNRVAFRVEGPAPAGNRPLIVFAYWTTTDGASPDDPLRYVVSIHTSPHLDRASYSVATAPPDALVRATLALGAGGDGFLRVGPGTTAVRSWYWAGARGTSGPWTCAGDPPLPVVDGRAVTEDGAGARRAWRLEVTFAPDGK